MTTTMTSLVCPKCGKDNRIEAKRCGNRSCQTWFKSAERTPEWKQKASDSNKKYWDEFYATEEGQQMKDRISATLSTPEAKERSRKLFMEHAQHLGNTDEARKKKSETHKRLRKENPDKYWGGGYLGHKPYSFEATGKRRSSKVERSLKPYLEPLGFLHSEDRPVRVVLNGKVKYPDFYNSETRQIVEVLGTYWHRDRILPEGKKHQTPEELISWYKESDWDCIVIWENELDAFKNSLKEMI
jgi:hypothetical protein